MARINAGDSDEVKREKLRIDLEKFRILESHKTRRYIGLSFFATVSIGIIAWAAVRMTDKPAWLEIGLAIIALFSGQTILLVRTRRRLGQLVVERRPGSTSGPADGGDAPEKQP